MRTDGVVDPADGGTLVVCGVGFGRRITAASSPFATAQGVSVSGLRVWGKDKRKMNDTWNLLGSIDAADHYLLISS